MEGGKEVREVREGERKGSKGEREGERDGGRCKRERGVEGGKRVIGLVKGRQTQKLHHMGGLLCVCSQPESISTSM